MLFTLMLLVSCGNDYMYYDATVIGVEADKYGYDCNVTVKSKRDNYIYYRDAEIHCVPCDQYEIGDTIKFR